MYENTGRRAHLMAAELIDAGVDVHEMYRRVYEGVPYGKLALLARGLANVERYDDGRLTMTALSAADFSDSGAEESYSEGVVDHLRAVQGTAVAALVRDRIGDDEDGAAQGLAAGRRRPRRRLGDRPGPGRRRPPPGGRLHHRALRTTSSCASCATSSPPSSRAAVAAAPAPAAALTPLSCPGDYVLLYDKPAGITSHDVVARVRRTLPRKTKVGHAGTLDPFATGLLLVLVGRATRVQRFLMALPKRYEATARFGAVSSTGDPEGEIVETGVVPTGDLTLPTGRLRQRPPAYSAVKVGGRRAYAAGPGRGGGGAGRARDRGLPLRASCWRDGDRRGVRDRVLVGHLRAQPDRRPRRRLLRAAAPDRDRRTSTSPTPIPSARSRWTTALAFLPEVALDPEQARRAAPRRRGRRAAGAIAGAGAVRLTDAAGADRASPSRAGRRHAEADPGREPVPSRGRPA